jgi:hypothetical protein
MSQESELETWCCVYSLFEEYELLQKMILRSACNAWRSNRDRILCRLVSDGEKI